MKNAKLAFWIIVLGFLALIIYQNQDFFWVKQSLHINLFSKHYPTPPVLRAIWFFSCFFLGLLIAYFSNLSERFRSNKTIKSLNTNINELTKKNADLEQQVFALQRRVSQYAPEKPEAVDQKLNA